MHQIIYASEARPGLGPDEIFRIVEQSARNNPSADITGFLIFRGNRFLQLVEGPLMSLETLLTRLADDERHHSLTILSRMQVSERWFPRWRMRRLGEGGDALEELTMALTAEGRGRALPEAVQAFLRETVTV